MRIVATLLSVFLSVTAFGQSIALLDKVPGHRVTFDYSYSLSKDGKPMEPFRRKMFVDYRKGGFKMVEPMPEPMKDNEWDIICNGDIVVIGNIHDDPQLIDMKHLG